MFRRLASALAGLVMVTGYLSPAGAAAQEPEAVVARSAQAAQSAPVRLTPAAPVFVDVARRRPPLLVPLYVSMAGLQALDAQSTFRALGTGRAIETNRIVGPFTTSGAAMVALKAGVTCATILGTESLWKRNPVAAVVAMVAVNSAYAVIVAHNYRLASRVR